MESSDGELKQRKKTANKNKKNKSPEKTNDQMQKLKKKVENLSDDQIEKKLTSLKNGIRNERDEGDGESLPETPPNEPLGSPVKPSSATTRHPKSRRTPFSFNVEVDMMAVALLLLGIATRMYRLDEPRSIVFDELHYGKYATLYMKGTFFFDSGPPLGKQLIAASGYLAGFDAEYKFDRIGSVYNSTVPVFALRFVPAFCGSLLIPTVYLLALELGFTHWSGALAGLLFVCDNAILTQSRLILMESMLQLFGLFGLLAVLKFRKYHNQPFSRPWWSWLIIGGISLLCATSVKYVGFFSYCLGFFLVSRDFWQMLAQKAITNRQLIVHLIARLVSFCVVPLLLYLLIFYAHLKILVRAGPHDNVMTSAFQSSLEGGLASIVRGQPVVVAHGSQVTLRHTHGRPCWLHSHAHVYPVRYPDNRGSSHQQQVTCYTFKDVNNWWIVKRPNRDDLVVNEPIDVIHHGDIVQLIHGMTHRPLNSHDVAAAMSPQNQEVSCYINYNVSMPPQHLWRVEILNKDQVGEQWHTIESQVRLIHVNSSTALKFSGRHLPEWGFNQHEVVTDKIISQLETIWNVEEHRYTKNEDQKDRERELARAEMIPTSMYSLTFMEKFMELQFKMLFASQDQVQHHMYSSEPTEWPLLARGIAYWVSANTNAQIHLLGNVIIWLSGTIAVGLYSTLLVFYLLRRRRQCFDISKESWQKYVLMGEVLLSGYLMHYLPYFFIEKTMFLHMYLPALSFKILLLVGLIEHLHGLFGNLRMPKRFRFFTKLSTVIVLLWVATVLYVFTRFLALSYGLTPLSANDVMDLRWRDSWDFIIHKP